MNRIVAPSGMYEAAPSAHAHNYRPLPGEPCGHRVAEASPHNGGDETNLTPPGIHTHVKQKLLYCDFYNFMSLEDFLAWVERNDGSEPDISHIQGQ